jgi:hypothetical protein
VSSLALALGVAGVAGVAADGLLLASGVPYPCANAGAEINIAVTASAVNFITLSCGVALGEQALRKVVARFPKKSGEVTKS